MALHGPIAISLSDGGDNVIGYWSARRTRPLEAHDRPFTYECVVTKDGETTKFEVEHLYSDGAISLMAKVFAKCELMDNLRLKKENT